MKTTTQRLQAARKSTAEWLAKCPTYTHYHDWRNNVARPFKRQPTAGRWARDYTGPKSSRPYYIDSLETTGWRMTGDAADILPHRAECNWYADNHQDATIKSAVLQLPSRDGSPVYIPATYCTDWDGATCYPLDQHDTPEAAARAAAGYAECEAEESREYYAKDQAEQDINEAREEIHRINAQALALAREIKQQGRAFSPAICSALRDQLLEFVADRREQFRTIAERQADHWSAVQ